MCQGLGPKTHDEISEIDRNLTPSEIDGGCFWLFLQAQKGDTYFTELAERAEYGNHVVHYYYIILYYTILYYTPRGPDRLCGPDAGPAPPEGRGNLCIYNIILI